MWSSKSSFECENENKNNKNSYIIDSAFEFCVGAEIINTIEIFKKKKVKKKFTQFQEATVCVFCISIDEEKIKHKFVLECLEFCCYSSARWC